MRRRISLACLALVLPLALGACGGLTLFPVRTRPGVHSPGVARDTLHSLQDRAATNATYKMVLAKRPPTQLIADDGSYCIVDQDTYAATKIRDKVRCVWSY